MCPCVCGWLGGRAGPALLGCLHCVLQACLLAPCRSFPGQENEERLTPLQRGTAQYMSSRAEVETLVSSKLAMSLLMYSPHADLLGIA